MKKSILFSVIMMVAVIGAAYAQETPETKGKRPSSTYIKDPCFGSRLNFGVTFAPSFDWMYARTPGYEKDGIMPGIRYGVNLNINLTERKSYYFSTGLFIEHVGGKMRFLDNIPVGSLGIADSTQTKRTYRSVYLTIPTAVTLKTGSINNFFVCGNVGLLHSFNLKSTNADSYILNDVLWSREKQASQETSMLKESLIAGLGFEYSVTPNMRAGVMINYVHGITNYFKGKGKAQNGLSGADQRANLGYLEIALNINFF